MTTKIRHNNKVTMATRVTMTTRINTTIRTIGITSTSTHHTSTTRHKIVFNIQYIKNATNFLSNNLLLLKGVKINS